MSTEPRSEEDIRAEREHLMYAHGSGGGMPTGNVTRKADEVAAEAEQEKATKGKAPAPAKQTKGKERKAASQPRAEAAGAALAHGGVSAALKVLGGAQPPDLSGAEPQAVVKQHFEQVME